MINELRQSSNFSVLLKILARVDSCEDLHLQQHFAYSAVMFHKMSLKEHEQLTLTAKQAASEVTSDLMFHLTKQVSDIIKVSTGGN